MNKAEKKIVEQKARILDRLFQSMKYCGVRITFEKSDIIVSKEHDENGEHVHFNVDDEDELLAKLDDYLFKAIQDEFQQ